MCSLAQNLYLSTQLQPHICGVDPSFLLNFLKRQRRSIVDSWERDPQHPGIPGVHGGKPKKIVKDPITWIQNFGVCIWSLKTTMRKVSEYRCFLSYVKNHGYDENDCYPVQLVIGFALTAGAIFGESYQVLFNFLTSKKRLNLCLRV